MIPMIASILFWIAAFISFFPLIISIIKTPTQKDKKSLPLSIKIMQVHLMLAFLFQMGLVALYFLKINYSYLFHLYIVEEFVMDMLFYRELLKKTHPFKDKPIKQNIFLVGIVLFIAFAIINALLISSINKFPMYLFIVQCIVMIICTLQYHTTVTRSATKHYYVLGYGGNLSNSYTAIPAFNLQESPVFWMNKGKLLYFSISLPIFILYNLALDIRVKEIIMLAWSIQNVTLIVLHIFMGIGFLKYKSNPTDVTDMEQKLNKQL